MPTQPLNEMVSTAVSYLLEHNVPRRISHTQLAKLAGVAQSAISMNLRGERGWSLNILEQVSTALGTPVEEIIMLGRALAESDGAPVFPWPMRLAALPPASDERLSIIVKQAAGGTTALASLVNPQSIRDTMPVEYEGYKSGKLTDGEMFFCLRKRIRVVEGDCKFIATADESTTSLLY